MSKVVDNRVVEMRFDNKQFESGVRTTMSTLEKLKQSLKLEKASKGLENLNSAAKNVNMSGLTKSVETVQARFSALQVVGVTALANITNAAINAGKNLISSLTIAPVMDGFREYETQMGSIQTILANTESKGRSLGEVNAALAELNKYADQTIYNFSEMTRNIGTFTAAGVDLDLAVSSIKGIANLAAVSGSSSQQASVAMYQLSQAIAAGKVQLMDWNSVVNAGMGGEVFQNALKRTAEHFGTNVDAMIKKYGSFRESLTQGEWLTTEVLTETLTQLSGAYSEADLIAQGYTEQQAKDIVKLAETALNAATKVKTFSQLLDTTREAIGSGWSQTWQIIFGDFEEATDLFTGISNALNGFINSISEARNNFLSEGLSTGWKQFIKQGINDEEAFRDTVKQVAKDHGVAIDEMIDKNGSFDKSLKEGWMTTDILSESLDKFVNKVSNMSAEQLKEMGYTEEQVEALKNLKKSVDDGSISLEDFSKKMNELSGRENIIEGFKNIFNGISSVIKPIKDALSEIFEPLSGEGLYNATVAFKEFTSHLTIAEETADKLKRTFKGVFSIIKLVATIVGGVLSTAFKVVNILLGEFFNLTGHGVDGILGLTAAVGDAITNFQEWVTSLEIFDKISNAIVGTVKGLVGGIKTLVGWIKSAIDAFVGLPQIQSIVKDVGNAFDDLSNFAGEMFENVQNGTMSVIDAVGIFADKLGTTAKSLFDKITATVTPLIDSIKNGFSEAGSTVSGFIKTVADTISKIDLRPLTAIVAVLSMLFIVKKLAHAFDVLTAPLEAVTDAIDKFGGVMDSVKSNIKAKTMSVRSKSILDIAKAIAILVGSITLLTQLDTGKVWGAVAVIGALMGMIAALTAVSGKFGPQQAFEFGKLSLALVGVSASMLVLSFALKNLGDMNLNQFGQAFLGLATMVGALSAVLAVFGKFVKGKSAQNINKAGVMLLKLSATFAIMTLVVKMISKLNPGDLSKGMSAIIMFSGIMVGLTAMTKLAGGKVDKVGSTLLKISAAMGLMVVVVKMISRLEPGEILKGVITISLFGGIIAGLTAITRLGGKEVGKIGGILLSMSASMAMLVLVVKMLSGLEPSAIVKGIAAVTALAGVVSALVAVTRMVGSDAPKIATTIMALSIAIGILAGVSAVLSLIDLGALAKGITAVSILSAMMALMVLATKGAQSCKGNLIVMVVAIGMLVTAAATLSLIDESKLRNSSLAISTMMATFALIVKSTEYAKKSMSTLIVITAVVAALSGILAIMSALNVKSAIQNASGIAILLTSMSASMFILSKTGDVSNKALSSMGTLTLIVAGLATILGIMSALNVKGSIETAASLSLLLMTMSSSLVILSMAKTIGPQALISVGVMTLVVAGLAGILAMLSALDIGPSLETAASLSLLVISLSSACILLGAAGLMGPAAFVGIGAFVTLVGALGSLMLALGGLVTLIPDAKKFLNEGIEVLNQIASGIGSFVGNIVGGFLEGASSNLPKVGKKLSEFMESIKPFLDGANGISESSMAGVKILAETIGILTSASLVDGISSFVTGGSSLSSFAEQLVPFGEGLAAYSDAVSGIKSDAITASVQAAKGLADVGNAIPTEGGFWSLLAGNKDLSSFGQKLVPFGKSMKEYSNAVSGLDAGAINNSVAAAKGLADVANAIPTEGGFWSLLAGDKDLSSFGQKLVPFGKSMKRYSETVAGLDAGAINNSVAAAKGIAKVANSIPTEGGIWSIIAGEQNLEGFGNQLVPFGKAMSLYSTSVAGVNSEAIANSVGAAKAMVNVAKAIPGEGIFEKLGKLITGGNDPSSIIKGLIPFGKAMKQYAMDVAGIDAASISASVGAAKAMVNVAKAIPGEGIFEKLGQLISGGNDPSSIIKGLIPVGKAMKQYAVNVAGIDIASISASVNGVKSMVKAAKAITGAEIDAENTAIFSIIPKLINVGRAMSIYGISVAGIDLASISNSVLAAKQIIKLINSTVGLDASGVGSFVSAINTLGQASVSSFVAAFNGASNMLFTSGLNMMNNLASGILSGIGMVISSAFQVANSVTIAIQSRVGAFISAGMALSNGLNMGINSRRGIILATITTMLIQSVSNVRNFEGQFRSAGAQLVRALDDGIRRNSSSVGRSILNTLSNAIRDIRGYHGSFYDAGSYLVSGFANGISENSYKAAAKARAMAKAARIAAENELGVASPSKVFKKIGGFVGEGFAIGIESMGSTVKNSSVSMARNAIDTTKNALSRIGSVVDSDLDVTPKIRPVVDMSNAESAVSNVRIGANIDASLTKPIDSLSKLIHDAQSEINASNQEVVSAINGLRDDLNALYSSDDQELALYVDSKKLASSLAKPMNRQLNILARRGV